jgi:exopolysaccharide biosynthesis polyprenyl glycosylphosphotransferase
MEIDNMFILARIKQLILLFGDAIFLFASLYVTLILRYGQSYSHNDWQEHLYPFGIIYFIWLLVFYSQNLYNLQLTKNNFKFFKTLLESFLINIVIASAFFYFTPFFGIAPKTNLFLNTALAVAIIAGWRALFNLLTAKYLYKSRIVFLGYSKEVRELMEEFLAEPQMGYECVGIVSNEPVENLSVRQITTDELVRDFKKLKINTIAIHHSKYGDKEVAEKLYKLLFSHIAFVNVLKLFEEITGKVPIETISQGWFFDNLQESEKKIYDRLKVAGDYFLGLVIFIFFVALFPFVALIILITSGRPVFYTQTRVGKNGKEYKIYKYRTMIKNAETGGAQFAVTDDKRVTTFGRFLRKTRIDELPQTINLLRGEMSFVGPRPERPEFVAELTKEAPFYPIRHLVKPGLTGWAQINYPYAASIKENINKLQYDIFYVKTRSLLLDLTIILKTFNTIIRFRGR